MSYQHGTQRTKQTRRALLTGTMGGGAALAGAALVGGFRPVAGRAQGRSPLVGVWESGFLFNSLPPGTPRGRHPILFAADGGVVITFSPTFVGRDGTKGQNTEGIGPVGTDG